MICLFFLYKTTVIIEFFKKQIAKKLFFILYNNINFYKKVKK